MKSKIYHLILFLIISFLPVLSQWEETNNSDLNNEIVNCLLVKDSIIFAGTMYGGIYVSTNNGDNWVHSSNGINEIVINCFASFGNKIYCGTDGGGVYLSTDLGKNWKQTTQILDYTIISSIASDGNNLFAGIDDFGIFLSTNDGLTWKNITNGINPNIKFITIINDIVYVGTYNDCNGSGQYFISTDKGGSWIEPDLSESSLLSIEDLALCDGYLFACNISLVHISKDSGYTWEMVFNGISHNTSFNTILAIGNNILTAGDKVFISSNYGKNWNDKSEGIPFYVLFEDLVCNDKYVFAATHYGVYRARISDIITSVNDQHPKQSSSFQVFPNPSNHSITAIINGTNEIEMINLYSIDGKFIKNLYTGNIETGEQNIKLNVEGVSTGTYLIKRESLSESQKIIIE